MRKSLNTLCQTAALIDFFLNPEPTKLSSCQNCTAEATDCVAFRNNGWLEASTSNRPKDGSKNSVGKGGGTKISRFSKAISS